MKTKLIFSGVALGFYGLYYVGQLLVPVITKKVMEKEQRKTDKLNKMEAEAIDVEWRFV